LKRLQQPSGELVAPAQPTAPICFDKIVRTARLIHSGPHGSNLTLESSDGELSFDSDRIRAIVAKHNAKILKLAEDYGGLENMPIGAFPAILDSHEDDSNDRLIGRLNFLLRFEIQDVPGVGIGCACVLTEITFLGEETVKRVNDGRIFHLSVGITDEEENPEHNTLGEVSSVIEPAAPGAMLLKKGHTAKGANVSKKRLAATKKRLAALKEIQGTLKTLGGQVKESADIMRLAKAKSSVTHRLSKAMETQKLTPATLKTLEGKGIVKRLAKMDKATVDIVMDVIESYEHVIPVGQRGTSSGAVEFGDLAKGLEDKQMKRLKAEAKGDLKRLSGKIKFKAKDGDEDGGGDDKKLAGDKDEKDKKDLGFGDKIDKKELGDKGEDDKKGLAGEDKDKKDLGGKEGGDPEAKRLAEGGDVPGPLSEDEMTEIEKQGTRIDELTTQIARIAGLVQELMTAEQEEESDLEGADPADKKLEGEGGDESEMSAPGDKGEKELGAEPGKEKELSGKEGGEKELGADAGKEKELAAGGEDDKGKEKKDDEKA
jgi:hypothetical protein